MEDYSKFEGKGILYNTGAAEINAKIAGIDPDIGITIVDMNGEPLACLLGPLSPQAKKFKGPFPLKLYQQLFQFYTEYIESGVFDAIELQLIELGFVKEETPSRDNCAFAQ